MTDASAASFNPPDSVAPHAAGAFDDLLDQATSGLSGDRELQLEVRQELRAHLEDAVTERIAAGIKPIDAQREARDALGDAAELSRQLYRTHERQLRIRKVAKRSILAALIPVAVLLLFMVGRSALLAIALGSRAMPTEFQNNHPWFSVARQLSLHEFDRQLAGLTPDDRLIVAAAFSGEPAPSAADRVNAARQLSTRWPENPVYYAHYVAERFGEVRGGYQAKWKIDTAASAALMREIDRGEKLEPDNGIYNAWRADLLFRASSHHIDSKIRNPMMPDQTTQPMLMQSIAIDDAPTFQRGLEQWRASWKKPRMTDYSEDLAKQARELLPRARTMNALLLQTRPFEVNSLYDCAFAGMGYALHEAEQNPAAVNVSALSDWVDGTMGMAQRIVGNRRPIFFHAFMRWVLAYRFAIFTARGLPQDAEAARAAWIRQEELLRLQWRDREQDQIEQIMLPTMTLNASGRQGLQRAEYAVLDRLALSVLLAILAITAVTFITLGGIGALCDVLRRQRGAPRPPRFVFIGWRRLARICCIAILAPLALHTVWARLMPLGHREQPLSQNAIQIVLEYLVIGAMTLLLLWRLTQRAVRRRGNELGLTRRERVPHWRNIALAFVGIAFNLAAVSIVLAIIGAHFRESGEAMRHSLLPWIWIPCLTPLCWIAAGMAWRAAARRHRGRMFLICAIVAAITVEVMAVVFLHDPLFRYAAWMAASGDIPASSWMLYVAVAIVAPMALMMAFSPAGESFEFAPFDRLLIPSALPVIGSAMILLALTGGWPLHHAETTAIQDMTAAESGP